MNPLVAIIADLILAIQQASWVFIKVALGTWNKIDSLNKTI